MANGKKKIDTNNEIARLLNLLCLSLYKRFIFSDKNKRYCCDLTLAA